MSIDTTPFPFHDAATRTSMARLYVNPNGPHSDGTPLVRAEQCIALLQRRIIRPMSRGGPNKELTLTQYHTLSFLASRGESSVADVADALGFARSTTSVLLAKLQELELVRKEPHAKDRRATVIRPTPKALRAVQGFRTNAEMNLRKLYDTAGSEAVEDLFVALEAAVVATDSLE